MVVVGGCDMNGRIMLSGILQSGGRYCFKVYSDSVSMLQSVKTGVKKDLTNDRISFGECKSSYDEEKE